MYSSSPNPSHHASVLPVSFRLLFPGPFLLLRVRPWLSEQLLPPRPFLGLYFFPLVCFPSSRKELGIDGNSLLSFFFLSIFPLRGTPQPFSTPPHPFFRSSFLRMVGRSRSPDGSLQSPHGRLCPFTDIDPPPPAPPLVVSPPLHAPSKERGVVPQLSKYASLPLLFSRTFHITLAPLVLMFAFLRTRSSRL